MQLILGDLVAQTIAADMEEPGCLTLIPLRTSERSENKGLFTLVEGSRFLALRDAGRRVREAREVSN
jgi:hypothetical protein